MGRTEGYDTVIVGAGGTGLIAAATLATLSPARSIALIEDDFQAPCNTSIASNFIPAAGTRFQRAAGIDDSPEQFARDIIAKNGGDGDLQLTQRLCSVSAETLHWMVDRLGIPLELAPELTWLGHSAIRMHTHPSRGGPEVVAALGRSIDRCENIKMFDRTRATGLSGTETDGITGLHLVHEGKSLEIAARNVVLACGGYGANADLVARHIPEMKGAPYIGARSDQGDALKWASHLGARTARLGAYQGRDCIFADGTRVTPPVLNQGGIAVNASGRRFVNELDDYSALARVYRTQPGGVAYFIWDQQIQDQVAGVFVMQQAMQRGGILRAEQLSDLARAFAIPGDELESTLRNEAARPLGTPDAFGRPGTGRALKSPFYAARITGAIAHTQGGLVVDADCRVLHLNGKPIPGLFAGGNAIAGLSGSSCTGYLSGNGLLVAYTSGYLIGRAIADRRPYPR